MITYIVDVECTTFQKGNPHSRKNKPVLVGFRSLEEPSAMIFRPDQVEQMRKLLEVPVRLVGFNIKFDLHWLQRIGVYDPRADHRIWDCQLCDFVLGHQQTPYPSLDSVAAKYGLGSKLDTVRTEYWDKGIDTDQIPVSILSEYLEKDLELTRQVFLKQLEDVPEDKRILISLMNQDLVVLQQMEYYGLYYNSKASLEENDKLKRSISAIESSLLAAFEALGSPIQHSINWNSNDELSCVLYGGTHIIEKKVPIGTYKSGAKCGQPRFKRVEYKLPYDGIVDPIKGTELKKEGYYKTDAPTLAKLKGSKEVKAILSLLKERAEKEKLCGTYLEALPKLIEDMDWDSCLHGQYNQSVAVTGRLSASKPNLQNQPLEAKQFIESRFRDD